MTSSFVRFSGFILLILRVALPLPSPLGRRLMLYLHRIHILSLLTLLGLALNPSLRGDSKSEDVPTLSPGAVARLGKPGAGNAGDVKAVAFSQDGITLASGHGDGTVRFWDIRSGKELRKLPGHKNFVSC